MNKVTATIIIAVAVTLLIVSPVKALIALGVLAALATFVVVLDYIGAKSE